VGTVYRKTATKPLPAMAKTIIHKGQRRLDKADALAGCFGLGLVKRNVK
jgi:hypothetical protein